MYLWAASCLHVSHYIVFCAALKTENPFSLVSLTFILAKRNGTSRYDVKNGAVHKVRQHFLGGRGQKKQEKVMMDWYKKVMTWGKGMSKLAKKVLTYFMDDSMVLENADNNNTIFAVKLAKTQ